jgi:hypothetical protein
LIVLPPHLVAAEDANLDLQDRDEQNGRCVKQDEDHHPHAEIAGRPAV